MIEMAQKPGDKRAFVHKRILRAAGGFVSGGFSGAARGFFSSGRGAVAPRNSGGRRPQPRQMQARRPPPPARVIPVPGIAGAFQRAIPGGKTGLMVAAAPAGGGCPQGFHPNKSDYMTRAGFVAEGTKCVRNRRRNLSNGRANTRSLRRMAAWDKQERKLGKTLKAIARGR